jgi:hypothetical protein
MFAFNQRATDSTGASWAVYGSPIMSATKDAFASMLGTPSNLLGAIEADIAVRWKGQTAPTLNEIAAFCSTVKYSDSLEALLGYNKLTLVVNKA